MGPIEQKIRKTIEDNLKPEHYTLENESHMHKRRGHGETHFKLIIVSASFQGQSRVIRQRAIYQALGDLMKTDVHALSLYTYTPEEWKAQTPNPQSPVCAGRSEG